MRLFSSLPRRRINPALLLPGVGKSLRSAKAQGGLKRGGGDSCRLLIWRLPSWGGGDDVCRSSGLLLSEPEGKAMAQEEQTQKWGVDPHTDP